MSNNVLSLNRQAMDLLRQGNKSEALEYLKKAESLLIENPPEMSGSKEWGITLNNLGSYYRRIQKPLLAIHHLKKAVSICREDPLTQAGSCLNLASIYLEVSRFKKALKSSTKATRILTAQSHKTPQIINALVTAHRKTGLAYENLEQTPEAAKEYHIGLCLAKENLGCKHSLAVKLEKQYIDALAKSSLNNRARESRIKLEFSGKSPKYGSNSSCKYYKRTLLKDNQIYNSYRKIPNENTRTTRTPKYFGVKFSPYRTTEVEGIQKITNRIQSAERKVQVALQEVRRLKRQKDAQENLARNEAIRSEIGHAKLQPIQETFNEN